jgi:Biotin-protein ligase, N terminal
MPQRIAVFVGPGAPQSAADMLLQLGSSDAGLQFAILNAYDIQAGALSEFETVIFPGGSGSAQAAALQDRGCKNVREFVQNGGGYLGVCGGAFLSSSHYSWSLGILQSSVLTSSIGPSGDPRSGLWYRGGPTRVLIEFSREGRALLGEELGGALSVDYHNGPIFPSHGFTSGPVAHLCVLAHYRSEICRTEAQRGTMIGTPALISSVFGAGRVVAVGPHLEANAAHHPLLVGLLRWLRRDRTA